jgi:DNA-binding NarL/FixJ family response regulator
VSIKVFIYDDSPARRDSLKALLELSPEMQFAGEGVNCVHVIKEMKTCFPDVVLMDINMPGADGIEGLKKIKENFPYIKVLMQTVFDDSEKIFECIKNGASGYILSRSSKSPFYFWSKNKLSIKAKES